VIASISTIVLNIVANVLLVQFLGFRGLALGTSVAMIANGGALVMLLYQHLNGLDERRLFATLIKTVVASSVMAAASLGVATLFSGVTAGGGFAVRAIQLAAAIATGLIVLAASAKFLQIREFEDAVSGLAARLK
jgi:putative peptidoglycan lipid II flippase